MTPSTISADHDVQNAVLTDRLDFTPELSIVRVRPDHGPVPDFVPGQFIKLGLPRESGEAAAPSGDEGRPRTGPRLVRRAYSIASSPRQREYLEFLVVRVDAGKLTPRLWPMNPGARIWMDDKAAGRFTLDNVPAGSDLVMVATGTGIAPFVSMLRTCIDNPPWSRAVLINGVRRLDDLGYRRELESLAGAHPHFHYRPVVSREPGNAARPALRGRVQNALEPGVFESLTGWKLDPHRCHVMLCGNPAMIMDVERILHGRGFHTHATTRPGNIHFERYW